MSWNHKLDISDVFHNDALTVAEKTETIVTRIKATTWYAESLEDTWGELAMILEELEDAAQENNVEWWDSVWDAFYDIADGARVWVVTR
jgi:hypothetical protein